MLTAVEAEIDRGLHYVLPQATIPKPLNTVVEIWPAGWYWLRGGSELPLSRFFSVITLALYIFHIVFVLFRW